MLFADKLEHPGGYPQMLAGRVGELETILTVPEKISGDYVALLGHPHSLQGGTMNNKVVTTMVRAFKELGVPSLRFNFRGVGQSEGSYDEGVGEARDMLLLMEYWQQEKPQSRFIFAGFSFGSYVAYRAATAGQAALLITIAPPVHHYNYEEFEPPRSWFIIQGDEDEVVPLSLVLQFAEKFQPPLLVSRFADTSHFFHGKLVQLKEKLITNIRARIPEL